MYNIYIKGKGNTFQEEQKISKENLKIPLDKIPNLWYNKTIKREQDFETKVASSGGSADTARGIYE